MNIYFLSYLLLPLCAYILLTKPKKLLHLAIFFVPFTGTALFDLKIGGIDVAGIKASFFIFTVYFFYKVLVIGNRQKFSYLKSKYFFIICSLILIVGFSQLMPLFISGDVKVYDVYSNLIDAARLVPLEFRFQYLTQALYCIFGLLITMTIYREVKNYRDFQGLLNIYLYANLFVVLWGVFEFISYYLSIPYPSFLFNQVSMNSEGIITLYGMPRIMSVTLEPSIMSQQLLTVLPFFLISVYERKPLFRKNIDLYGLIGISFVLLFSTSTTAYLGFFFCLVLIHKYFSISKKIVIGELILAFIALLVMFPFIVSFLVEKYSSYSGVVRIRSMLLAFEYFVEYPLFGIGWGVMPSWDLIFLILSGTGLVGLFLFGYLFYSILRDLNSYPLILDKKNYIISKGMFYSFAMLLFTSQISGFIYHSQFFWVVLGFSLSMIKIKNKTNYSLYLSKV